MKEKATPAGFVNELTVICIGTLVTVDFELVDEIVLFRVVVDTSVEVVVSTSVDVTVFTVDEVYA